MCRWDSLYLHTYSVFTYDHTKISQESLMDTANKALDTHTEGHKTSSFGLTHFSDLTQIREGKESF